MSDKNITTLELESKLLEIEKNRVEIQKFINESFKSQAAVALANKKAKWYELIVFGGAGITVGLALAKLFWF
jgi:hypothetical protein